MAEAGGPVEAESILDQIAGRLNSKGGTFIVFNPEVNKELNRLGFTRSGYRSGCPPIRHARQEYSHCSGRRCSRLYRGVADAEYELRCNQENNRATLTMPEGSYREMELKIKNTAQTVEIVISHLQTRNLKKHRSRACNGRKGPLFSRSAGLRCYEQVIFSR